jgi:Zn-dependent peptidase ImmA (M78 family)
LPDETAPLLAVNRRYIPAARIFTYGHELAHLIARTGSICLATTFRDDRMERWCEKVAGELLLPRNPVSHFVLDGLDVRSVSSIAEVRRIAGRFNVSLRATAYRLEELGLAAPNLYRLVDAGTDLPSPRLDDEGPRERASKRRFIEYGPRFSRAVLEAETRGLLSSHDLVTYLDLPAGQLNEWRNLASRDAE